MSKLFLLLMVFFLLSNVYAVCDENQIEVNSASLEELEEIRGIGPAYAQRIIDARPFNSVDSLIDVSGIGPVTLENIKNQGLACVKGGDGESEENYIEENLEQDLENENKVIELNIIALGGDSKDIKAEEGSEFQEKEIDYAVYGFAAFSVLIVFLCGVKAWKNKFKYKNEFG